MISLHTFLIYFCQNIRSVEFFPSLFFLIPICTHFNFHIYPHIRLIWPPFHHFRLSTPKIHGNFSIEVRRMGLLFLGPFNCPDKQFLFPFFPNSHFYAAPSNLMTPENPLLFYTIYYFTIFSWWLKISWPFQIWRSNKNPRINEDNTLCAKIKKNANKSGTIWWVGGWDLG